jgi:hypothetical protein
MLAIDSLVTDLMFMSSAAIDQQTLLDALGGEEAAAKKKLLDPDMLDPRVEMELSPSMPFRRRGERRLLIIDDSVAPLRKDPQQDLVIEKDLRPYKEELIAMCQALPVRLGRIFALGAWGDAVLVARSARDLRAICLLPWALDPTIDIDGKRRANRLNQQEFEAKILAFEKRLDELDDKEILASLSGVSFERRGELLVVDVLDAQGHWDVRASMVLENQLAAIERFSMIPGAPSQPRKPEAKPAAKSEAKPSAKSDGKPAADATKPADKPAPAPEPVGPPLGITEVGGAVLLVFPAERFDLDIAAALGKRDWDTIVRRSDNMTGAVRDRLHRDGGAWVAPLEFLSEVFVDGKPLTKTAFEQGAVPLASGGRALPVHFPRFGPAMLLDVPGKGRFVTSLTEHAEAVAAVVNR